MGELKHAGNAVAFLELGGEGLEAGPIAIHEKTERTVTETRDETFQRVGAFVARLEAELVHRECERDEIVLQHLRLLEMGPV